jgi:hypothetical protein
MVIYTRRLTSYEAHYSFDQQTDQQTVLNYIILPSVVPPENFFTGWCRSAMKFLGVPKKRKQCETWKL